MRSSAPSSVTLSPLYADNMIFQAGAPIIISGMAQQDETADITVRLEGGEICNSAKINAAANGEWCAELPPIDTCGADYVLCVTSERAKETIEIKNIAIGDVYLLAGQSNFERLTNALNNEGEIGEAFNPKDTGLIREFSMYKVTAQNGLWREVSGENVGFVSAVGYAFADELLKRSPERPIGIISAALGGSEIGTWLPRAGKCAAAQPSENYRSRILPLRDFALSAIFYYQGEQDAESGELRENYLSDLEVLINSYRDIWGSELPFYIVEIMRYDMWFKSAMDKYCKGSKTNYAAIRAAQSAVMHSKNVNQTNLRLIPTIDFFGNYNTENRIADLIYALPALDGSYDNQSFTGNARTDIHPSKKRDVGKRMADFVADATLCAPFAAKKERVGDKLILTFECAGRLRVMDKAQYSDYYSDTYIKNEGIDTEKIQELEISQGGVKYCRAKAQIDENRLILSAEGVDSPAFVRYAYANYPECPNLTDDTSLPASCTIE